MLSVSVLGPVELFHDGARIPVRAGKTAEVLIRLALDAGVTVRTERLIEDLWAGEALATSKNTLQTKISRLRRDLGDGALVSGGRSGYALEVDATAVDALDVLRLADSASEALKAGDAASARAAATSALAMFRGEILCDAGDGDWVVPYRARLEEVRFRLIEDQLAARMALGAAGEVVGELESLVALHPLRERLWALLITALYRDGRQADALAAYRRVRALLVDELGVDPGPELQTLEHRVLLHDRALTSPAHVGNLPSIAVELVGRDKETAELSALIAGHRLVEIVGPGGIGKTAVAIALGRMLTGPDLAPGGVWLVRLETAATADDVIDALIAAMNVPGGEAAVFERLKSSPTLVIFDNCEHVIDVVAALVARLLDAIPTLRILCTSQAALGIDGELLFELTPLALADAARLFALRAASQRKRPSVGDADHAVQDLCRALDGLPLAIELAAARTKTLSIEEITRRLDDRFNLLRDPTSRRPERRRALRATIGWSYELLFPDDKRGLWALATFAGGASLPALEFVLDALDVPASAGIDVIGRLASRSLIIVDDEGATTPTRYRLLDSIREFALKAMTDAGLTERGLAAHAVWFADAAGSSTFGVRSGRQAEHLSFARAERANIDSALAWSATHNPLLGVDIVSGFGWAWIVLGDSRGSQRILTALDAAGEVPVPDHASALLLAAWIEASTGQLELARDHISTANELAHAISDIDLQARASYFLAYVVSHDGEFRHALELTDRASELFDLLDRPWDQAATWLFAARAAISADDQVRSVEACDRVEHWLTMIDDPWLHVRRDAALGELARIQHRFDDAVLHLGHAAETSRRLGFSQTEAYQVSSLGRAQCQAGDYALGSATLELAIAKAEATGDVRMAALARVHLGRVLRALGQHEGARAALEAATAWHRAIGGGEQAALGECLLAAMDVADQIAGVEERLVAILDDARPNDNAPVEVFALDALARIAAEAGDIATARERAAAADERMEAASHFITDRDRTDAHFVRQIV